MGVSALMALVYPWCLVKVIDDGVLQSDGGAVAFWLAGVVVCLALSGVLRYAGRRLVLRQGLDAEKQTLKSLYAHVFNVDLRAIPEHTHGELMGRILSAGASERAYIEAVYDQGIPLLFTALGTLGALLALSVQLAVVGLLLFPFAAAILVWMRRRIRPAARQQYTAQESMFRAIVEDFRAMVPIRALHQCDRFKTRFGNLVDQKADAEFDLNNKMAIQGPILDILQALTLGVIFGVGCYAVLRSELTIGVLVGFQVYLGRLFVLIRSGVGLFGAYQHYVEGVSRADEILHIPCIDVADPGIARAPELLRVEHMRFGFGDHVVWDDKSLTIAEGEFETILLPSGGGKTTLARCILGLYPLWGGSIAVPDGNPKTIGFVPQENVLFDGTLSDNISLMCESLEDQKYREVLEVCALSEIAERFGNQTIGEQGMKLSGGEQRRVMLARALAASPRLLIIDQMVSELEPELCRQIFQRIRSKYPKMGILYLGHRMPEL